MTDLEFFISFKSNEVKDSVARKFEVSESERKKMSARKSRPIFDSRIIQIMSELRKEGVISNESRGVFKITKTGLSEFKKA